MRDRLTAAAAALRRVATTPAILRAVLAWMLGWAAEWAWLVALSVYAYAIGGVALVGIVGLARSLPAGILAPALSSVADRWPQQRVLLAVHAGRMSLVALVAVAAAAGWPPLLVVGVAALDGLLAVLHRPSHMAMMPALARSPDDLVAANVASGMLENVGILVGPIIGGVLVAIARPLGFAVPAAMFAVAAFLVLGIGPARSIVRRRPGAGPVELMLGGLRAARAHPHAGLMLGLFALQTLVRGALGVLLVVLAIEILGIGEEGVGYLNAAIGAGGLVGALAALSLVGRRRLAPPILIGLLLWGLPILLIGFLPALVVALGALAILGAGNAVLDIAGFSLLQRIVPNAVRGRIFGLLEANVMLTVGIGAIVAPGLVSLLGRQGALFATGLALPAAALIGWRWLRSADERAVVPERELRLLRGVPMFAALPMTIVEDLAARLTGRRFADGEQVVVAGEAGDSFHIISAGAATVDVPEGARRAMAAGESFGEIALLRDVPRTATVTADGPMETLTLDRDTFLGAICGDRVSMQAAEGVIRRRLDRGTPPAPG
jgi:MFS family permease